MQTDSVFHAVRRGYSELENASYQEILTYFDSISPDAMIGHISNIKGIAFEQEVVSLLAEQGINAELFEATNHPVVDISVWSDNDIAIEAQLKATDSIGYINDTLTEYPDIPIIATSEVARATDSAIVIDSGISNEELTGFVGTTLSGMPPLTDNDSEAPVLDAASENISGIAGDAGEGVFEAVTDAAMPISPLGIIGFLFGLPFF